MNLTDLIRPSAMGAIAECAGRPAMELAVQQTMPTVDEFLATAEAGLGNDAHEASRKILRAVLYHADGEPRGRGHWRPVYDVMVAQKARFPNIDSWTWACVRRGVDFVLALILKHDIEPEHVLLEHHLDGTPFGIERGGTADVVLVVPFKRVILVDFKYGFLLQDHAEVHDQLGIYATMVAATFKVDEVEVWLSQPRAEEDLRSTSARFDAALLANTADWSRAVAARAKHPDAEITPTWRACQHCRALPFCPAAKEAIMRAREAVEKGLVPTDPKAWGDLLRMAKLAGRFEEKATKLAKEHIARGGQAEGWEIGPGSVERVLPDPHATYVLLADKSPALAVAFWKAAKVSRPALDKEVGTDRAVYEHLLVEVPRSGSLREKKGAA